MAAELDVMANWATDGYVNNGIPRGQYEIPGMLPTHDPSLFGYIMLLQ